MLRNKQASKSSAKCISDIRTVAVKCITMVSLYFVKLITTLILLFVVLVEARNGTLRRRLSASNHTFFEDSITFLTDIMHHRVKPAAESTKPHSDLSFLSREEVKTHKSPDLAKKKEKPSQSPPSSRPHKPDHREKEKDKTPHTSPIDFLSDDEKKRHKPRPKDHGHHKNTHPMHMVNNGGVSMTTAESPVHTHTWKSPSPGTVITPESLMTVLRCPNQSKCVVPELQLQGKRRVYLCRHPTRHGVRFYYLTREGFLLHPNVELVHEGSIHLADHIVYLPGSAPWHLTECNKSHYASKLLVMDEFDGPVPLFNPSRTQEDYIKAYGSLERSWYDLYFKRSFVRRNNGIFTSFPHLKQRDVYPLTYSVAEAYLPHGFNVHREIEILCTLRGHSRMPTRLRVQEWVGSYAIDRNVSNVITSQVTTASRTTVSVKYFQQMYNAKIIVTVNPSSWEGDFRLWESLGSGALVFVDPLFVPHPFPLIHEEHVIFFNNNDKADLYRKLDYYRSHPVEAMRIAHNGYLHALKHHRTVNMIDYVLTTAHIKSITSVENKDAVLPEYLFSGQYLNEETKRQEKMVKKCLKPAVFESGRLKSDEEVVRVSC